MAALRAGAGVHFVGKIGQDDVGSFAAATWKIAMLMPSRWIPMQQWLLADMTRTLR